MVAGGLGDGGETGEEGDQPLLPPLFAEEIDEIGANTEPFDVEPQLVMRVRSQAELFWRVISYDYYTGTGWQISRNDETDIRTLQTTCLWLSVLCAQHSGNSGSDRKHRDVIQTYTITTEDFPNLVPAACNAISTILPQ
jgi:hypothetical protein